jgi:hypothetical protein
MQVEHNVISQVREFCSDRRADNLLGAGLALALMHEPNPPLQAEWFRGANLTEKRYWELLDLFVTCNSERATIRAIKALPDPFTSAAFAAAMWLHMKAEGQHKLAHDFAGMVVRVSVERF